MEKDKQGKYSADNQKTLDSFTITLHDRGFRGYYFNPRKWGEVGFVIFTENFKLGGFNESGNLIHVHCRKCNSEWKRGYSKLNEKFEVNSADIWKVRCRKCGVQETIEKPMILDFP